MNQGLEHLHLDEILDFDLVLLQLRQQLMRAPDAVSAQLIRPDPQLKQ